MIFSYSGPFLWETPQSWEPPRLPCARAAPRGSPSREDVLCQGLLCSASTGAEPTAPEADSSQGSQPACPALDWPSLAGDAEGESQPLPDPSPLDFQTQSPGAVPRPRGAVWRGTWPPPHPTLCLQGQPGCPEPGPLSPSPAHRVLSGTAPLRPANAPTLSIPQPNSFFL